VPSNAFGNEGPGPPAARSSSTPSLAAALPRPPSATGRRRGGRCLDEERCHHSGGGEHAGAAAADLTAGRNSGGAAADDSAMAADEAAVEEAPAARGEEAAAPQSSKPLCAGWRRTKPGGSRCGSSGRSAPRHRGEVKSRLHASQTTQLQPSHVRGSTAVGSLLVGPASGGGAAWCEEPQAPFASGASTEDIVCLLGKSFYDGDETLLFEDMLYSANPQLFPLRPHCSQTTLEGELRGRALRA